MKESGRIFWGNAKKKLGEFLLNYGENLTKILQNLEEIVRIFKNFLSKFYTLDDQRVQVSEKLKFRTILKELWKNI